MINTSLLIIIIGLLFITFSAISETHGKITGNQVKQFDAFFGCTGLITLTCGFIMLIVVLISS